MEAPLTVEEKMWEKFHEMWTKDATNHEHPDYDKKAWVDLEACILAALKDAKNGGLAKGADQERNTIRNMLRSRESQW